MIAIIIIIAIIQCYFFFGKILPGVFRYKNIFGTGDYGWFLKKTESVSKTKTRIVPKTVYVRNDITGDYETKTENVTEEYQVTEEVPIGAVQIGVSNPSKTMKTILTSINRYLKENASRTSDFALLKDIVDRNCDAEEDDTRELIPLPLYLGLAGTMLGIALGVGHLVFGGGLDAMFDPEQSSVSAKGIAPLLEDVSLAMICSFIGLVFTTIATISMRRGKSKVEQEKHIFLSWMQAKLLPEMPDNMSSVVMKLAGNLTDFNKSFSRNAERLNQTLNVISDTSSNNARLLEAVNNLNQVKIAEANIALYDKLRVATQQIGILADYLNNCSSYLNQVKALNDKLDKSEERMKAIEEMGNYFRTEKAQIEHVSRLTQDTIGKVEDDIRKSTLQFGVDIEKHYVSMQESLQKQADGVRKVLEEQQQALSKKTNEMSQIVTELKNLTDVKKAMIDLSSAYREQNRLLTAAVNQRGPNATPLPIQQPKLKLPIWLTVVTVVVAVLIFIAVVLYVAHSFNLLNF